MLKKLFTKHQNTLVVLFLFFFGFFAFNYYYSFGITTAYGDAMSRLDISRKILDNLTPGFAQVGSVWLPLPQILMLPFIWNGFLWHSGIAGSLMSLIAYMVGGFYLYKSCLLLTKNKLSSFLAFTIYALNINLLYMQTTAMSEGVFICFASLTMYYFLSWTKTDKLGDLIKLALVINGLTLTRYEGFAVLFASLVLVGIYSYLKHKNLHRAESDTIIFAFLAFLGFGLWTLYLGLIFGDPFYWLHYYAASPTVVPVVKTVKVVAAPHLSFLAALWKYLTAMIWMDGIIPILYAIIGVLIIVYKNIRKPRIESLPLLLPFSVVLFMILTLQKNTPINQPELTLAALLSSTTSYFGEFNIRYGLIMLPFVALFTVYVFNVKQVALKIVFYSFFFIQLFSYFHPAYTVIFQLPVDLIHAFSLRDQTLYGDVDWLQKHYDGGLIMVSELKHDPQMFKLGVDFRTYIHEGTSHYWKTSIKDPSVYATWVWLDYNNADDQVTRYLKSSGVLRDAYTLVYNQGGVRIYRIKGKVRKPVS